jgi:NDP-sugar pyrophosphorylase family protein
VVTNGDIMTDLDFRAIVTAHRERKAAVTVSTRLLPVQVAYGVVEVAADAITRIREKPEVQVPINAGVYVLSEAIWPLLPPGADTLPDLANRAIAAGLLAFAFPFDDYWIDIGAMPDYLRANEDLAVAAGQKTNER